MHTRQLWRVCVGAWFFENKCWILGIENTVHWLVAVPVVISNEPNKKVGTKFCTPIACGVAQYFQGRNIFQTNVFCAESAPDAIKSNAPSRRNDRMTKPSPLHFLLETPADNLRTRIRNGGTF